MAFNPKPRRKPPVRETGPRGVQKDHKDGVALQGGWSLKWVSPGTNGVPDQIDLFDIDRMVDMLEPQYILHDRQELREIAITLLASVIVFTECKAPGKTPTKTQLDVHKRLRLLGFTVNVVDQKRPK